MTTRTTRFPLTPEQEAVAALREGAFLVIAPPGSGKTTVLTERVARLVSDPAETFRVLALTFTNKATANMRERLFEAIGKHSSRVTVSTFHAFCLDVLGSYGERVGVPTQPSIYDNDDDRLAALERGIEDDGYSAPKRGDLRKLLGEISGLKRSMTRVDDAPGTIEFGVPLNAAYGAYERVMRQYGALDFDDLLIFTYRLFLADPRVAAHYRRMYRHIVMDEAQDTSTAQFEVLRALCGAEHRNVMLVADGDQLIYAFAGAKATNLQEYKSTFGAQLVALTQNFRCAQQIVAAANRLIANNPDRITTGQDMAATTLAPGQVGACSFADEAAEAAWVRSCVEHLLAKGLDPRGVYSGETTAVRPEEICVLGRTRYALAATMHALDAGVIRYVFAAGRDALFETAAFRAVDASLRLIANPADTVARRAVIRYAPQAVSGEPDAATPSRDLLASVEGAAPVAARGLFRPLVELAGAPGAVDAAINALATAADAGARAGGDDEAVRWPSDAGTLTQRWQQFAAGTPAAQRTIAGFVAHLALAGRSQVDGPGVRVLTVHAAKGLEFRAVILVGMNEGTFPDFRSVRSEKLVADERRNAYVAITRAERFLALTRPRARATSAGTFSDQPSRFLTEMGIAMANH